MRFVRTLRQHEESTARRSSLRSGVRHSPSFEALISASRLHYWRPGMPVSPTGDRLLVGLAPGASMLELRLAELLDEQLTIGASGCSVDVFNLQDIRSAADTPHYFNNPINLVASPIAGFWRDGRLVEVHQGAKATMMCLQRVGFSGTFEQMLGLLCPRDPMNV